MSGACDMWTPDGTCGGKLRKVNAKVYVARHCDKCGNHSYGHLSLQQLLDNQKFNLDLQDEYLERVDKEEERKEIAVLSVAAAAGVALNVQRQKMLADKEATVLYFRKAVDVLCVLPGAAEARAYNLGKIALLKELYGCDISKKLNTLFASGLPEVIKKLAIRSKDNDVVTAELCLEATKVVGLWSVVIRANKKVMTLVAGAEDPLVGRAHTVNADAPVGKMSRKRGPPRAR